MPVRLLLFWNIGAHKRCVGVVESCCVNNKQPGNCLADEVESVCKLFFARLPPLCGFRTRPSFRQAYSSSLGGSLNRIKDRPSKCFLRSRSEIVTPLWRFIRERKNNGNLKQILFSFILVLKFWNPDLPIENKGFYMRTKAWKIASLWFSTSIVTIAWQVIGFRNLSRWHPTHWQNPVHLLFAFLRW